MGSGAPGSTGSEYVHVDALVHRSETGRTQLDALVVVNNVTVGRFMRVERLRAEIHLNSGEPTVEASTAGGGGAAAAAPPAGDGSGTPGSELLTGTTLRVGTFDMNWFNGEASATVKGNPSMSTILSTLATLVHYYDVVLLSRLRDPTGTTLLYLHTDELSLNTYSLAKKMTNIYAEKQTELNALSH